jgi:hypothetical protein
MSMTERIDYATGCRRTRRRWVKKMLSEGWAIVPSAPHRKQRSVANRKKSDEDEVVADDVARDGRRERIQRATDCSKVRLKWMAPEQIERQVSVDDSEMSVLGTEANREVVLSRRIDALVSQQSIGDGEMSILGAEANRVQ